MLGTGLQLLLGYIYYRYDAGSLDGNVGNNWRGSQWQAVHISPELRNATPEAAKVNTSVQNLVDVELDILEIGQLNNKPGVFFDDLYAVRGPKYTFQQREEGEVCPKRATAPSSLLMIEAFCMTNKGHTVTAVPCFQDGIRYEHHTLVDKATNKASKAEAQASRCSTSVLP